MNGSRSRCGNASTENRETEKSGGASCIVLRSYNQKTVAQLSRVRTFVNAVSQSPNHCPAQPKTVRLSPRRTGASQLAVYCIQDSLQRSASIGRKYIVAMRASKLNAGFGRRGETVSGGVMKKLLLGTTAIVALMAAESAGAVDMPIKAPPILTPISSWAGFYIGGAVGVRSTVVDANVTAGSIDQSVNSGLPAGISVPVPTAAQC